ncbi:MAG TPA: protein kinase, partial [Gemmataceae bacterium]|nr:protein kinase [Gemmataceae bacterium]
MTDSPTNIDPAVAGLLADVADEFHARLTRGEDPDPDEYAARYPEAADAIRGVLATLQLAAPSTTPPLSFPDGPLPSVFGDYRIFREVGRGGMGVVYAAEQISLRRRVALKILPLTALADPRLLQRFKNEARAAAALDHPHIAKVHAVGHDGGVHYLAMQYIDGRPLSELIHTRHWVDPSRSPTRPDAATRSWPHPDPISPPATETVPVAHARTVRVRGDAAYFRQVAEWGAQAADALEHAHSMGVVHRDVKPGNLLIDRLGQLWVSDFGLAKLAAADVEVTLTGDVFGTLRYMSPEQALAKHNLVDHRTDLYSLGATLYELLTGRPAVDGKDKAEILRNITDADPLPIRTSNREVPADLETIVLKCLRKDANGRYASAKDLANDLRRFMLGVPVVARPVGLLARAGKWSARRPYLVGLAATTVMAIGVSIGLGFWTAYREAALEAERARKEAAEAELKASRQREEQQRFFGLLERVRQRRSDPYPGWSRDNLTDLRELAGLPPALESLPDLRSEAAAALSAFDLVYVGCLAADFPAYAVDYSADGKWLVVAEWRANPTGVMRVRVYATSDATFRVLTLEPDDGYAAWVRRAKRSGGFRAVRFSPNGRWLVAGTQDGRLARWDLSDPSAGPQSWIAHRDDNPDFRKSEVRTVGFAADGTLLSSSRRAIRGWTVASGTSTGLQMRDWRLPLDFHSGADKLPITGLDPKDPTQCVYGILDLHTGKIDEHIRDSGTSEAGVAPGGGLLTSVEGAGALPQLRSADLAAKPIPLVAASRSQTRVADSTHFLFDQSGGMLAVVEEHTKRMKLWDVASGLLAVEASLPKDAPRGTFAPDGGTLAVAGLSGVTLFKIPNQVQQTLAVANEREVIGLAATTDHGHLVTTAQEQFLQAALYQWRPPAVRPVKVQRLISKTAYPVADFSDDGRTFVYSQTHANGACVNASEGPGAFQSLDWANARFGPGGRLWLLSAEGWL